MTDPNPYDLPPRSPSAHELDGSPSSDERNLAIIAHLSGCAGLLGAGFIGFIGPLLIYLIKKDSSPYLESQAKEALNFQITIVIIGLVCAAVAALSCGFLFPVIFIPMVMQLIFSVIAAVTVRDGSHYRYPINLRLLT